MITVINAFLLLLCILLATIFVLVVTGLDKPKSKQSVQTGEAAPLLVRPLLAAKQSSSSSLPDYEYDNDARPSEVTGCPTTHRKIVTFGDETFLQQEISGHEWLCLYRSIADQYNKKYNKKLSVKDIRKIAKHGMHKLVNNPDSQFSALPDDFKEQLKQNAGKKWKMQGEEIAFALAEELKTPITMYTNITPSGGTSAMKLTYSPTTSYDQSKQPLTIVYDERAKHFESLHPLPMQKV